MRNGSSIISIFFFAVLVTVSSQSVAYDSFARVSNDPQVQLCYGFAMVGMDSVINSRIGVPPEHALELSRINSSHTSASYSTDLLSNILTAYSWQGSPHSYAINVFYQCAQRQTTPMLSANP